MPRGGGCPRERSVVLALGLEAGPAPPRPTLHDDFCAVATGTSSEKRVTNFTRNNKVYSYNDGKGADPPREYDLDRDNDGIACERL